MSIPIEAKPTAQILYSLPVQIGISARNVVIYRPRGRDNVWPVSLPYCYRRAFRTKYVRSKEYKRFRTVERTFRYVYARPTVFTISRHVVTVTGVPTFRVTTDRLTRFIHETSVIRTAPSFGGLMRLSVGSPVTRLRTGGSRVEIVRHE